MNVSQSILGASPAPAIWGRGTDAEQSVSHFGFATEPVVDLGCSDGAHLYRECVARMIVPLRLFERSVEDAGCGIACSYQAALLDLVLAALAEEPDVVLNFSVPAAMLADGQGWHEIIRRLSRRPLLARRLIVMITGPLPSDAAEDAAVRLATARATGCRLALEACGRDAAILASYRKAKLEWDIVKLDRAGLSGPGDEFDRLIPWTDRARELAPHIVVAGLESREHSEAARAAGARWGQGPFFLRDVLERWRSLRPEAAREVLRALIEHGARISAVRTRSKAGRFAPQFLVSQVTGLGGTVRALVSRARAGAVPA